MNESASEYQSKILDLATNRYLDQIAPPSEDNLKYIESNVDEVVWKVATQIYQQSGFKADLTRVKDIVISRIENMRLQLKLQAEQEAAEEAQRAAKLRAEEERKAAEEAQRAAQLRAEAERRAAEEAQRAAQLRAEEERRAAEAAKRVAELLEKFDGNQNKVEIFIKIQKIVSEQLEIDEEAITLDSDIYRDLDADSLDVFELIMAVEEEFDVDIKDIEKEKFLWNEVRESPANCPDEDGFHFVKFNDACTVKNLLGILNKKIEEKNKYRRVLKGCNGDARKANTFFKIKSIIAESFDSNATDIDLDTHISDVLNIDEIDTRILAKNLQCQFDIDMPGKKLDSVKKWLLSPVCQTLDNYNPISCYIRELLDYVYDKICENDAIYNLANTLNVNKRKAKILEKIKKIIAGQLRVDEDEVNLQSHIYRDFQVDDSESQIKKIFVALENEFYIQIPEKTREKFLWHKRPWNVDNKSDGFSYHYIQFNDSCTVGELLNSIYKEICELDEIYPWLELFDGDKSKAKIFVRLRKVIAQEAEIDEEYVRLDSHIGNDLHVDELDVFNLAMAVEEEFDMEIPEEILGSVEKWPPSYSSSNCFRDRVPVGRVGELLDYIYQKIYETTETE
ncbi:acyl carrier protein [Lyngbya sp. CCY1209]|uniref:acyl carrier protein n=1 Tax=Lyngbya sp. CCY1209 TaxID=2886103 RepID=UPI002D20AA8C|nr:acyl carrier protein [Lyngbya sp. CCY1209]MEB3882015.1 acyl carrier protein [Lyngbya sp. CCY1209]